MEEERIHVVDDTLLDALLGARSEKPWTHAHCWHQKRRGNGYAVMVCGECGEKTVVPQIPEERKR